MSILVTGVAGFIGFHTAKALAERGDRVVGVDNVNDYYDPRLKEARLAELRGLPGFAFVRLDFTDRDGVLALVAANKDLTGIIHLAAQAGVRHSLENPYSYVDSNIMGTVVILEAARRIDRLSAVTYASSSSVYGANRKQPSSVDDPVNKPVSLYAASKRSCELIAHSYSHLYGLPATGLRYFTAYGPWGRPDMAAWLFTQAILADQPIKVFNEGRMARDFTYIDDIVAGTIAAHDHPPAPGTPRMRSLTGSTTSATTNPNRFSISSQSSNARSAAPQKRSCCRCNRATWRRASPISKPPAAIWVWIQNLDRRGDRPLWSG